MDLLKPFRKEPPPPPPTPWFKKTSVISIIITLAVILVIGPVGTIYNSMSEELKKKVDNETLQLMIEKDREALQRQAEDIKEREEKDEKQDAAILENQKTLILLRQQQKTISTPKNLEMTGPKATMTPVKSEKKLVLTPEQFEKYLKMSPEVQVKYKKYLESRGYDVSGL